MRTAPPPTVVFDSTYRTWTLDGDGFSIECEAYDGVLYMTAFTDGGLDIEPCIQSRPYTVDPQQPADFYAFVERWMQGQARVCERWMRRSAVDAIADNAECALWAVVADSVPAATTGELSVETSMHLSATIRAAIAEWIELNA